MATTPGKLSLRWTIWANISEGAPMLGTITPGYRAGLQRLGHLTKNADQNSMRPLLLSILGPGSRLNGKTLPNCHGLRSAKTCGIKGLAVEGCGRGNGGDNVRRLNAGYLKSQVQFFQNTDCLPNAYRRRLGAFGCSAVISPRRRSARPAKQAPLPSAPRLRVQSLA